MENVLHPQQKEMKTILYKFCMNLYH